jgi:tRNA-intron endonuclease
VLTLPDRRTETPRRGSDVSGPAVSDSVVGVVALGHPPGLGGVLLAALRIFDCSEVARIGVDGSGRVTAVGERRERTLLPEVLRPVAGGVGEDYQVLFVVGVGPLDQPDPDGVVCVTRCSHASLSFDERQVCGGRRPTSTTGAFTARLRPERMDATFDGSVVRAGRAAREQFYDARGYGRPDDGGLVLAPVEAAHLLFRGDLDAVVDGRPAASDRSQRLDFQALLSSTAVSEVDFFVYADLRSRGFYLSPTPDGDEEGETGDFVVYPRGQGPWDDDVAYRVATRSERAAVTAAALRSLAATDAGAGVLAVVDEESEVTYLELAEPTITGSTHHELSPVDGDLLADRVLVWDAPALLHDRAFYGQRLDAGGAVQLSLVEAAYLARRGVLTVPGGETAVVERGQAVEGGRFDRRLRVYGALRSVGVVPKTGFKFGADFRTYADVTSVDDLGHSDLLVRVLPPTHTFAPRALALDVRLAGGVRKRMAFALTGAGEGIEWLSVGRLTP